MWRRSWHQNLAAASSARKRTQEEEAGDSDGEGQSERTGTVAWDMADDEPVRPQWPWTEEEKAKRALQEDDPDYRDVKRETYEAIETPGQAFGLP